MSDWGLPTREHTFSTGRQALLRKSLPVRKLVKEGIFTPELIETFVAANEGKAGDPHLAVKFADACCQEMFVEPKIVLEEELNKRKGKTLRDGEISIDFLEQSEIGEVIELAFASIAESLGFRGNGPRTRARVGGKNVGKPAKRAARPRARKPGGVPARQKAR